MIIFSQVNVAPINTGASGIGIIYVIAGLAYLILWLNKFNQRTASTLDIAQLVIGASALLLNGFIMIFPSLAPGCRFPICTVFDVIVHWLLGY